MINYSNLNHKNCFIFKCNYSQTLTQHILHSLNQLIDQKSKTFNLFKKLFNQNLKLTLIYKFLI